MVTHVVSPGVRAAFDRLRQELPQDHDAILILSCDDDDAPTEGLLEEDVERISLEDVQALGYPQKCRSEDWDMAGNLDTVFLVHRNRRPQYTSYWFVEYDVHWEGDWRVFFEHFRASDAAVLGATVQQIDEVPHKEFRPPYPKLVVPDGVVWSRANFIKAFLPICRISGGALDLLDAAYQAGLGGHYEVTVPSIAANNGLTIEDYGGNGGLRPTGKPVIGSTSPAAARIRTHQATLFSGQPSAHYRGLIRCGTLSSPVEYRPGTRCKSAGGSSSRWPSGSSRLSGAHSSGSGSSYAGVLFARSGLSGNPIMAMSPLAPVRDVPVLHKAVLHAGTYRIYVPGASHAVSA